MSNTPALLRSAILIYGPYKIRTLFFSCLTPLQLKQAFNVHHIKRLWHTNQEFIILRSPNLWQFEFWIIVITLNHQSKGLAATDIRKRCKEGSYLPCLDSPAHCKNVVGRPCDTAENPWKYNLLTCRNKPKKSRHCQQKAAHDCGPRFLRC